MHSDNLKVLDDNFNVFWPLDSVSSMEASGPRCPVSVPEAWGHRPRTEAIGSSFGVA